MKRRNGEGRDCGWRNITGGRARVEREIRLNEREERVSKKARGGGRAGEREMQLGEEQREGQEQECERQRERESAYER